MPPASPTPPPPPTLNWLIFRGINLTCLCLRAVVFLSPSPSLWGASSVGVVVVVGGEGNGWQWQRGRERGEKKKRGEGGKDGFIFTSECSEMIWGTLWGCVQSEVEKKKLIDQHHYRISVTWCDGWNCFSLVRRLMSGGSDDDATLSWCPGLDQSVLSGAESFDISSSQQLAHSPWCPGLLAVWIKLLADQSNSEATLSTLVLSVHTVLHVSRYNDAQGLSFHYCWSVPTNQAHGPAFHFH